MGRKANVTVKEYRGEDTSITFWLPPSLKVALIERANNEHRSITGHLLHLIEQDLTSETPSPLSTPSAQ